MDPLCRATTPSARFPFRRLALTVAAGLLFGSSSYAATFGHSRIASAAGEPLVIMVPVSGLSAQDIQSLSARVAPAADWAQAGLVPPVALDGLRVSVEAGVQPASRVLRVQSSQALEGTLADLLIDVHTASGQQRYQVTLLASGPARSPSPVTGTTAATPASPSTSSAVGQSAHSSTRRVPEGTIAVRKGDNMFAIARRHAVDNVTVYQMMMALQRTNPEAFIEQNINLVKAGERLVMPGMDELLALSDRDARRAFQAQAAAFAEYRARHGGKQGAALTRADQGSATQGGISQAEGAAAAPVAQGDHLSLSSGAAPGKGGDAAHQAQAAAQAQADTRTAQGKAVVDAQGRVSQLEENVGHLSEALKAQGEAARSAVLGGAKDLSKSLTEVADAVSQASRDAVAQADGTTSDPAAAASPAGSSAASGSSGASAASGGASATSSTPPGASSASDAAPGTSSSTSASAASGGSPVVAAQSGVSPAGTAQGSADPLLQPSPKAEKTVSWLQEHLLGVMTGLLALIVLVIAWLLRRANSTRDDVYAGAQVTEAMVKEKLQNIDLDLTPEAGGTKRRDG